MQEYSCSFTLGHPITQEDWDKILDVDMEHIPSVTFTTKGGKEVEYVKVIRCRECRHWDKEEPFGGSDMCECKAHGGYFLQDDFCSDGERRESE